MDPTIVVIAPGEMGAAVGRRLRENGAQVRTSLRGLSAASAARAVRAGLVAVEDDAELVEGADILLSIVPPGEAMALVRRLVPALTRAAAKPIYVDCNAISPRHVAALAEAVVPTGCAFVDAGIIGPPPGSTGPGPRFYVSGAAASRLLPLRDRGLDLRLLDGEVGVASALKMAYASLTKGLTAIGAAMMLAAMREDIAPALKRELGESRPALLAALAKSVPDMYPKAYRWVAEMEEIAQFMAPEPGAEQIYLGAARLYEALAADVAGRDADADLIGRLDRFLDR